MKVHPTKIPPHVNNICLHSHINLHTKTTAHTIVQKSYQMPIIHLFTTTSPYNHTYNTHSLKTKIYNFIHNYPKSKSPHLILSCTDISISGNVVGNPLMTSQNIGNSGPEPPFPALQAAI